MEKELKNSILFDQLCEEWLSYKKPRIKESAYSNYKFSIDRFLKRSFYGKTLEFFVDYNFNQFVEELQSRLANKTTRKIGVILKSILRYAERKYDFDFKLDLMTLPLVDPKEIEIFTDRERLKLERHLNKSQDIKELGIYISLYAGLRIGETCALKWSDIDFENKLINITHTLQRVYVDKDDTKVVITNPKTKQSIRKIPIARELFAKLKEMKRYYENDDYILTGRSDRFVEPIGYRYTYKKVLRECRLQYKNYHCLRHTFATRCIRVGMDVKSLSEILGHSNISITLSIYVHSSYEIKKKFIDRL